MVQCIINNLLPLRVRDAIPELIWTLGFERQTVISTLQISAISLIEAALADAYLFQGSIHTEV
jgi:hypothetical protein